MMASRRPRSVFDSTFESLLLPELLPELGVVVPEDPVVTALMGSEGSRSEASWAGIVAVWLV